jgi:AcrR family transcriptional regulator
MSGNREAAQSPRRKPAVVDRRIARTRDALGDALIVLMKEKPFDEISVQQVLDRAGISRSTFYTHYRDKDDLFISDVEEFFLLMAGVLDRQKAAADRVAPVRELFAHVSEAREVHAALRASGKMPQILELGRQIFARSIEQRLRKAAVDVPPMLLEAHAQGLAGSLFALLDWWIDRGMTVRPEAMDALFHGTVWTATIRPKAGLSRKTGS